MKLVISSANNYFNCKGALDKYNIHVFKEQFKNVFRYTNAITLSIENLTRIDRYGVHAIAELQNEALTQNKRLSIIGYGQNDIFTHFKTEESA